MYRLVFYREQNVEPYLSGIVSETVYNGLQYLYGDGGRRDAWFAPYLTSGFFDGLGEYFGTSDGDIGIEILDRKARRMMEKMEDRDKCHTFDLLEERLFYSAIREMERRHLSKDPGFRFVDKEREETVSAELILGYGFSKTRAKSMARTACRFHEMNLKKDEEENLFFWDGGFVEGIGMIKSASGENMGYGYDHALDIFADIGIKVPITLTGTKEGVRVANEEQMRIYNETMKQIFRDMETD